MNTQSNQNELYHYGVPKRSGRYPWGSGKRPYQGDGGHELAVRDRKSQKRANRKEKINKAFDNTVKNGKDKPNISPAEKIARNAGSATNDVSRIVNASSRMSGRKNQQQIDLSKMTDQELKTAINRMDLERRYTTLTTQDNVSRGKEYVDDILDIVGATAGITGSIIGTIAIIKSLK